MIYVVYAYTVRVDPFVPSFISFPSVAYPYLQLEKNVGLRCHSCTLTQIQSINPTRHECRAHLIMSLCVILIAWMDDIFLRNGDQKMKAHFLTYAWPEFLQQNSFNVFAFCNCFHCYWQSPAILHTDLQEAEQKGCTNWM